VTEREGGWRDLWIVQLTFGVPSVGVVLAAWVLTGLTLRRFGTAPAVVVAVVVGAAAWCALTRWIEPRLEREVERRFGPAVMGAHGSGLLGLAGVMFGPSMTRWRRVVYAFALTAPAVRILVHA
jgi:hypothetical protein